MSTGYRHRHLPSGGRVLQAPLHRSCCHFEEARRKQHRRRHRSNSTWRAAPTAAKRRDPREERASAATLPVPTVGGRKTCRRANNAQHLLGRKASRDTTRPRSRGITRPRSRGITCPRWKRDPAIREKQSHNAPAPSAAAPAAPAAPAARMPTRSPKRAGAALEVKTPT
ncbi:unnamed protein product, partial [Ectocarpus sp. 12 AP-2014]